MPQNHAFNKAYFQKSKTNDMIPVVIKYSQINKFNHLFHTKLTIINEMKINNIECIELYLSVFYNSFSTYIYIFQF